ncbi:MAG: class I SAM-dependent methyltransferase [Pseudomonadales bacterium]
MSRADAEKWNARYREGAYAERDHPSAVLVEWLPEVRRDRGLTGSGPLRALDVACGAGRNARYLAAQGFVVDALDVSGEALARAAKLAGDLPVRWLQQDLDDGVPALWPGPGGEPLGPYHLIVMIRYLNLPLLGALCDRLAPGGYLLCEEHLLSDADVIGPRGPRFRVRPGALAATLAAPQGRLEVVHLREGLREDPDGRPVALAQLLGRHPPADEAA